MTNSKLESKEEIPPTTKTEHTEATAITTTAVVSEDDNSEIYVHLSGWRLVVTTCGLLLCLYLVNLEVTIVSTSLVNIANDLSGFDKSNWIITGYLITYTGFIIVWTKLSDIVGRKPALAAAMTVFSTFSVGCGAARTVDQL